MFGKKNKKNNNTTREPSFDASEILSAAESSEIQPEVSIPENTEEVIPEVIPAEEFAAEEAPVEENFETKSIMW